MKETTYLDDGESQDQIIYDAIFTFGATKVHYPTKCPKCGDTNEFEFYPNCIFCGYRPI